MTSPGAWPRSGPLALALVALALGSSACSRSFPPEADGGAAPEELLDEAQLPGPCGLLTCAADEACCQADGSCFSAARGEVCTLPDGAGAPPDGCLSAADCGAGELCVTPLCYGSIGACAPRDEGPTGTRVCGCDGNEYANAAAAYRAGVNVASFFPCGTDVPLASESVTCATDADCARGLDRASCEGGTCRYEDPLIVCGTDEDCAEEQRCCPFTRFCVEDGCDGCCAIPERVGALPCASDRDCARYDLSYWELGAPSTFCDADLCEGPGGCVPIPRPVDCGGEIAEVCGCDGQTYLNACQARRAAVRVASVGPCS
ncbi:MAG: hypothetical protein ACFCGT_13770 [Sandaracinaceae bacterium]